MKIKGYLMAATGLAATQRAIRHGEWKAVTVKKGVPLELYRISEDPCEQHNLANDYPQLVKELDERMWQMRTPSENYPFEGEKLK